MQVALIDDDITNCLIVEDALKDSSKIQFMGFTHNFTTFKKVIKEYNPDIALIDIDLGNEDSGMDVLKWLQTSYPKIRLIMITVYEQHARECYSLGAHGYILKDNWEELIPTITRVYKGEIFIPKSTVPVFLDQVKKLEQSRSIAMLSASEKAVIQQIIKVNDSKKAAEKLGISSFTVRRHLQNLRKKFGVKHTRDLLEKFGFIKEKSSV